MNETVIALLCEEQEQTLKAALDAVELALVNSAALLTNVKGQPISDYWSRRIVDNEARVTEAYSAITTLYLAFGFSFPEAQRGAQQ